MAERLVFEFGQPLEIALKYAGGKNVQGKYGPQAQYSTVDDQIFWLDAEDASQVDHQLADLGIQPREYFRITKIQHARGGGSSFRIQRCHRNGTPVSPAPAPDARLEAQLRGSIELAHNAKNGNGKNGHDTTPPAWVTSEPARPPAGDTGAAQKMMAAFAVAIDALAEARDYGTRKGFKFDFNEEDARCCALSVFINESRK